MAPPPTFPEDFAAWRNLPKQTDAYLQDHFGLRRTLPSGLWLHHEPRSVENRQAAGSDRLAMGGCSLRGDQMIQQSAGLIRRDEQLAGPPTCWGRCTPCLPLAASGCLSRHRPIPRLSTRTSFPLWARNWGQRTEYDVLLDDLAARGVPAVDLRPALIAARAQGKVYRMHDTHWTRARCGGRLQCDRTKPILTRTGNSTQPAVLGAPETIVGGDLARLLGMADELKETVRLLALPPGKREALDQGKICHGPWHKRSHWTHDHDHRRFIHRRLFRVDAVAAHWPGCLAASTFLSLRLEMDRPVSAGRGLVDADRTLHRVWEGRASGRPAAAPGDQTSIDPGPDRP